MISRIIKAEVCVICRRLRWISGVLAGGPEGHAPPPQRKCFRGRRSRNGVPKLHKIIESTHKSVSPNWNFSDPTANERKIVWIIRLFNTLSSTRRLYFTAICRPPLKCYLFQRLFQLFAFQPFQPFLNNEPHFDSFLTSHASFLSSHDVDYDAIRNKDVPSFLEALRILSYPEYHLHGRCISHTL